MKIFKWSLLVLITLVILVFSGCERTYDATQIVEMYAAIHNEDLSKVKRYIKRYPGIENSTFSSMGSETNALSAAVAINNMEISKFLIKAGTDVNYQDRQGVSALLGMIQSGNFEYVRFLLEAGADPSIKEYTRSLNAYHYALQNPSIELLDLLYEHSKLIDEPDKIGRTPLVASAIDDRPGADERTLWFLERGADYKTVVEMTPDMVPASIHERRNEVTKYLIVNAPSYREYLDFEGNSVSHFSVGLENDEVLDCLLKNKHYSNAKNDKGETPLEMAKRIGREDMVEKIEAYLLAGSE